MFTNYFQLEHQPFIENIPVPRIIQDERMQQALARLKYLYLNGNAALITGETGVGKSTLIRLFLDSLPQKQFLPIYIHFTHVRSFGIFYLIVNALGEDAKRTKDRLFLQIVEKTKKISLIPLLIIDEAHLLDHNAITDLRLLISSALDDIPPIKIILLGQLEIKNKLKTSSHTDFAHRISVYYHIQPLTQSQTHFYIDLQMKKVGVGGEIFEIEVKDAIFEYSKGIPRQINNIATACLINASIQKVQRIDSTLLNHTMSDFQLF